MPKRLTDAQVTGYRDKGYVCAVPVPAGSMSLHHTHTPRSSPPNRSADRRIGVGIGYIPARVKPLTEPRNSALLVRGVDHFRHSRAEERLVHSESAAARAAHAKAYDYYMRATGIGGSEARHSCTGSRHPSATAT